eukprot:jgi/Tetstr1/432478/TSEL_021854.t1
MARARSVSSQTKTVWLTAIGLALVLATHIIHVDMSWLPHSRRAPRMAQLHVTATSHSAGASARMSVRVGLGRGATAREEGGEGEPLAPGPQEAGHQHSGPRHKHQTKWQKNTAKNARRQKNLEAHINGSQVPKPPAFEFHRSGVPGGLLAADSPGEPPIHLLAKTNLHLNQAQFDRDGTRGGIRPGRETAGFILSASLTYPMLGPNGTSAAVHYSFNPADVSFFPPEQLDLSYGRCAVVGNSATLLRHEYGPEIDSHDMVLRMNYAPVAGYERHVGSKATFDMINSKHAESLSADVVYAFHHRRPMLDDSRQNTSIVLFEATNWKRNYYIYSRLLQKLPPPQLLILSPDFYNQVEIVWKGLSSRWPDLAQSCKRRVRSTELGFHATRDGHNTEKGAGCQELGIACGYSAHRGSPTKACKATSGFVSIMFAAQFCNSITLYGFENVTAAAVNDTSHYFDDEPANLAAHSYSLTQNILHHLASMYPIDIRGA